MSTLYQVHSINGTVIYYDSYRCSCFISPEDTASMNATTYDEIHKWCLANRRVLSLLDAYAHSGNKFIPDFCEAKDAELVLSSPLANREMKENAWMFLQDRYYASKRRAKRKRKPQKGYIYVLKADNSICKIGKTKRLEKRTGRLEVILPYDTELVCTIKVADMTIEKELHKRFAGMGKHVKGEWFDLDKTDIEYIKSLGTQDD